MSTVPHYQWRARTYAWAQRAIAQAEAVHGPPELTCVCGGPITAERATYSRRCETCDPPAPAAASVILHFLDWRDKPACRATGATTSTANPRTVTCGACLRTRVLTRVLAWDRMVTA